MEIVCLKHGEDRFIASDERCEIISDWVLIINLNTQKITARIPVSNIKIIKNEEE